ncbi:MAG: decarboxylase [Balneolaceae bacterium]|nr:MAG: decarboxylase [Balneolaceae bacterium]
MMYNKISLLNRAILACFLWCSINVQASFAQSDYTVENFGELRLIMHQADISAKVELSNFAGKDNFYGLGAFENLKGEILIMGESTYSTRGIDGHVEFVNPFEKRAALLVGSTVDKWQEFKISQPVLTFMELQKAIQEKAAGYGLDMNEPFPFLIEGNFGELDWHVIDWPEDDHEHTHEKHKTSGPHGTLIDSEVKILGFWSDSHHGIFTHHTTNLHMHFVTGNRELAGHVDDLKNGSDLILYLPHID